MAKKLEDLYITQSCHEGLFTNLKRFGNEVKKRASVQAFPERPPEPKYPQPAHVERKMPNLGQLASEKNKRRVEAGNAISPGKAALGGVVGSMLGGPWGAVAGAMWAGGGFKAINKLTKK